MVRLTVAMLGAFVVLLVSVACSGSEDGAVSASSPSGQVDATEAGAAPTDAGDRPEQDADDWFIDFGRAVGPITADFQGTGVAVLECVSRVASEGAPDYSQCQRVAADAQTRLVALRAAIDGVRPPPEGVAYYFDAFDTFASDGEEAYALLLAGLDTAPGSLEGIRLFDQFDALAARARDGIFAAGVRYAASTGVEIPQRIAEGLAISAAIYEKETYDRWAQSDFEYLSGLEAADLSIDELIQRAESAQAALDDYLLALRALPAPQYEPFAEALQRLEEGYETVSESYRAAIDGFDPIDDVRLSASDQLRSDGFQMASEAGIEFGRSFEEVVAARE